MTTSEPSDSASPTAAGAADKQPAVGGTLNLSLSLEPDSFNSILWVNAYSRDVIDPVYSRLFEFDTNWEPHGDLAEDWTFSDDGLTLTVKIKDGVKFHNGDDLTAEDVAWTLSTILHPDYKGTRASNLSSIESIEAADPHTVVFTMKEPFAPVLTNINFGIMNHRLFADVPVAELASAEYSMHPIGSGPYKFVNYKRGEYVILERNPDWFRSAEFGGAPFIERIHYRIITDAATELAALENDEIDLLLPPASEVARLKTDYAGKLVPLEYERNGWGFIVLNNESGVTADKAVRQALTYAIDRQTIIDAAFDGLAAVPAGPVPPVSWAFDASIKPFAFDPAQAAEILDAAGWVKDADGMRHKDGERLTVRFFASANNPTVETIALLTKQYWEDIGVEVDLQFMEHNTLFENHVGPGQFDAWFSAINLSMDPDSLYNLFHSASIKLENGIALGNNRARYSNPEADKLLEAGRRETDFAKRKESYAQFQAIFKDDAPIILLYSNINTAFYNGEKIKGGVVNMPGHGPERAFVYRWWIDEQ